MCGIIGTTNKLLDDRLDDMLSCITHRGPDESGKYINDDIPARMGMRRLSIIDRDGGDQPIYNEDETIAVTFNGEIYNYRELRDKLTSSGHVFRTDCDTEVLVHAWEEYGREMPTYLDGMFAFAICDETDETVFLARDRVGIKPLYYSFEDGQLYWASELQPLLQTGIDTNLDKRAVYNYFNLRYFAWPQTPFENIRKLPPSTSLLFSDGDISTKQYWELEPASPSGDRDFFSNQFRSMFEEAVDKRLMADVPLGAFLSGGLDSSAIVALMSEQSSGSFDTFSVGFENDAYDESDEAAFVADHFGTNHHEITVDLDSMDLFGDVVEYFGVPLADPAILPTLAISQYASERVKVVLSGEGADELFGGYWYNDRIPNHQETFRFLPDSAFKLADSLGEISPVRKQTLRYFAALQDNDTAMRGILKQFDTPAEEYLEANNGYDETDLQEIVADTEALVSEDDFNKRMAAYNIKHWLPDGLLYKVDQASMAASLEARVPFLDHNLVQFAYNIPAEYKQDGYKPVVNQAMEDILPSRIRNRTKHGFSVPTTEWFRRDHHAVTKWLEHSKLASAPYVNPDKVHDIWQAHKNGADNSRILWKILTYVAWYHRIVRGAPKGGAALASN